MDTEIIARGRTNCVIVYSAVRTRVAPRTQAPRDERELDQERRCARIPMVSDEPDFTREIIFVWYRNVFAAENGGKL